MPKLFAVYLGGNAPKANTELHDVVFVTGDSIEQTYDQLLEKWFGTPESLHIDSWIELDVVDGWRITLSSLRTEQRERLFFVNLGAYRKDIFAELHETGFYVASNAAEAVKRAKAELFKSGVVERHKDDVHEVDDCIALEEAGGLYISLTKTDEISRARPQNGYLPLPARVIADYVRRQK